MKSLNIEGYTDKLFYSLGDTIQLFVNAKQNNNIATLNQISHYKKNHLIETIPFDSVIQELNQSQSEFGCK